VLIEKNGSGTSSTTMNRVEFSLCPSPTFTNHCKH
jgi:hypothetical protein